MKKYVGTKIIEATPMTRGDYNQYRGWTIPENENPADEGYLVMYPDGYKSWSPGDVFEAAYRLLDEGVPFGVALEMLKRGYTITRKAASWSHCYTHMDTLDISGSIRVEDLLADDWIVLRLEELKS